MFEDHTDPSMVFIFNVHQLVAPKETKTSSTKTLDGQRTKIRKFQEDSGSLYEYLTGLENLIVIADESHLYGASAKAFNQALKDLKPAATIGLTASADKRDHVIYQYPLHKAISDGYVKAPVLGSTESPDTRANRPKSGSCATRYLCCATRKPPTRTTSPNAQAPNRSSLRCS